MMGRKSQTHHCDKCGMVLDPTECCYVNVARKRNITKKDWRGNEYGAIGQSNLIPQSRLCDECASMFVGMFEEWKGE